MIVSNTQHPNFFINSDIIELIVDELAGDDDGALHDLTVCSLVSHSFLLASRKHIFANLIFPQNGSGDRLMQLDSLCKSNTSLPPLVKSAIFHNPKMYFKPDNSDITAAFVRLLHLFINLKSLEISSWGGRRWELQYPIELHNTLFKDLVRSQHFTNLSFNNVRAIPLSLFTCCPGLKSLLFDRCEIADSSADSIVSSNFSTEKVSGPKSTRLRSLTYTDSDAAMKLLAQAAANPDMSFEIFHLQTMRIREVEGAQNSYSAMQLAWDMIFPLAFASLTSITYDFLTTLDVRQKLSLRTISLPALTSLTFITYDLFGSDHGLRIISELLLNITDSTLQEIEIIDIAVAGPLNVERAGFRHLELALLHSSMTSLRLLTFKISLRGASEDINIYADEFTLDNLQQVLTSKLPAISSASRLQMKVIVDHPNF